LANIVHEVTFLAAMPTRVPNTGENPALAGSGAQRIVQLRSAMAARDRLEQGGAVHEASSDYAASAPADASASEADAPVNPDNASPATDMPPVDSSHDE
jgi:hypothetical protein